MPIERVCPSSGREIHHARRNQPDGASHSGATAQLRLHLTFDEGKQIGVHLFGLSDRYTVRATRVNSFGRHVPESGGSRQAASGRATLAH